MIQEPSPGRGVNDSGATGKRIGGPVLQGVLGVGLSGLMGLLSQAGCVDQAQESEPVGSGIESRRSDAEEIRSASARFRQRPDTDRVIHRHVAAQARQGRLVDALNVNAAILGDGELVWEDGSRIEEARFLRSTSTDVAHGAPTSTGEILELAFQTSMDLDTLSSPPNTTLVGPGMGSASHDGGDRLQNSCQTWTVKGRSITGCYQLFKPTDDHSSTRDYYAYNRWATAVGQEGSPPAVPVEVDIRSRPHASHPNRVVGMSNYFPIDASQLCNAAGSVNIGVGSLALQIPLSDCADKSPIPDATAKTMGIKYDQGFIFGGPLSKGVDFEMEIFAWQDGPTPVMGDYNYAKFCSATLADCTGTLGKDGW